MNAKYVAPLLAVLAFLCLVAMGVNYARAQGRCAPHDEVVKVLHEKYQEKRKAMGLVDEKTVMEVYVSAQGTWTVIATDPSGISCLIIAGEAWEDSTDDYKPGQGT